MIQCERCGKSTGGRRGVDAFRNDLFHGWFCSPCVDEMVNEHVRDTPPAASAEGSPT